MKSKYDAILLLGLKLNADGTPKHELTLRIETAADCWKKKGWPRWSFPAADRRKGRRSPRRR